MGLKKPTEARFMNTVVAIARVYGWVAYHTHDSRKSDDGFPDLVFRKPDRIVVAELKTETGVASPEQLAWLAAFSAAGVPAFLWRPSSWPEIQRVLGS